MRFSTILGRNRQAVSALARESQVAAVVVLCLTMAPTTAAGQMRILDRIRDAQEEIEEGRKKLEERVKGLPTNPTTDPKSAARKELPPGVQAAPELQGAIGPIPEGSVTGIGGVFVGHYICAQGYTPLKLTIVLARDGTLTGVFAFQPPGGARGGVKETAFAMKGQFTAATGQFQLKPDRWVTVAPVGYRMAGIAGSYDARTGALQAKIEAPGCSTVDLKRDATLSAQLLRETEETHRQMENLPPGAIAAGRFPQTCLAFQSWASRVGQEYPGENMYRTVVDKVYPKILNLFEDEYFTRFFGKPFDELDQAERTRLGARILRQCLTNSQYRRAFTWERQLDRPFILQAGSFSYAQVMGGVIERRRLREELRHVMAEIDALPASAESWTKAIELEGRSEAFAVLWPSEHKGLDGAVRKAKQRAAAPAVDGRLQPLLASARGFADLEALEQFPTQQLALFESLDGASAARYRQQIADRVDALVGELLAKERSRMDALPSGLAGLEQGAVWYQQFQARFGRLSGRGAEDLSRPFLERRSELLTAARPELAALIQQAKTSPDVSTILSKYVALPTDQQSAAVGALQLLAKDRSDALQRAAVLGAGPPAPGRAATTDRPTAGAAPLADPAKREPSEGEMYDAVKALVDNYNANMEDTDAACRSGRAKDDPFLAIQCLGVLAASGGRGGIQMQLTSFSKVACEKANERSGWLCDYRVGFSASGLTLPPSMEALIQNGDVGQKRFVWDGERWLALQATEAVRVVR